MGVQWKPMHEGLNIFFNDLFVKNSNTISQFTKSIIRINKMINRINDSKNTYLNDAAIVSEKKVIVKNMVEKRSKLRAINKRLLKYVMTEHEINQLTLVMNKEIIAEVLQNKVFKIPYNMGTFFMREVKFHKNTRSVHWPKSIANHLAITKKDAPIIHDKYINKQITKREYFKYSRPFVAPRKPDKRWLYFNTRTDWIYLSWKPNYAFMNKVRKHYRLRFTSYSGMAYQKFTKNDTTREILEYLDTPEKILDCFHLGNVSKSILLQIQDPNYKIKILDV